MFGLIISPDNTIKLNHRAKNKQYTSGEELCHKDGFVVIRVRYLLPTSFNFTDWKKNVYVS